MASSLTSSSRRRRPPRTMTYSPRGSPRSTLAERAAHDRLVQLRQLPGDGDGPVGSARLGEIGDRAGDPVRRLVEHDRASLGGDLGESPARSDPAARQEPFEHEAGRRQPTGHERGDECRRTGDGGDLEAGVEDRTDEQLPRVADPRRPGVGDHGDVASRGRARRAPRRRSAARCARCRPPAACRARRRPAAAGRCAGCPRSRSAPPRPAPRSTAATGRRGCRSAWRRAPADRTSR